VPETLALRLWDAHYLDRRQSKGKPIRDEWAAGETAAQLVDWIEQVTKGRETVWLYCHNLSFDLITTRLPMRLAERGWFVSDASIGGKSPWMRLGLGKRRLGLFDSGSWLPMPLEEVGKRIGVIKPPLPPDDGSDEAWHARCRADVTILETAMLQLMDWWDRQQLGRWNISGAASGWNTFRHTQSGERVTIDPDPGFVAADRKAVHGGRRGVWSIGEHRAGPFVELDFAAAYPTIAAQLPLPIARTRRFDSLPVDDRLVGNDRWGVLAACRIRTDVPRWPVRFGRHSWYPVGEFWADLAGPDIELARQLGALEEIGPGAVHRLGGVMMPWARWCLDTQYGRHPDSPPAAQITAKAWGRSVIGKWAARSFDKVKLGDSPNSGWGYEEGWSNTYNCHGGMVDLGGTRFWVAESADPDNAYPAVLAWVEAHVRTRLNRVIDALGPGCVMQCDTDGMIVAQRTVGTRAARGQLVAPDDVPAAGRLDWVLDQLDPLIAPLTLRVKSRAPHMTILGPQHLTVGDSRRYAGLPGMVTPDASGHYVAKLWPKLQWQLTNGNSAGYVRPERKGSVVGPYPTGWILADRTVVPVESRIGKDGTSQLIGWESSSYARRGLRRADQQHNALMGLW
jgi:hypothetical protein